MKRSLLLLLFILSVVACSNKKSQSDSYTIDNPPNNTVLEPHKLDSVISDNSGSKSQNMQGSSYSNSRTEKELDNMRSFDPASEDDMEDNGLQRYFDANDEESWD